MAQYFHVDWKHRNWEPGCQIELEPIQAHWSPGADGLKKWFPQGVSEFGKAYLCGHAQDNPDLVKREAAFESVRTRDYSGMPSRFSSIFAWQSLDEAFAFRRSTRPEAIIWELECSAVFVADMEWLKLPRYAADSYTLHWLKVAASYWNGDRTPNPVLECLLTPPVTVVKCVHR